MFVSLLHDKSQVELTGTCICKFALPVCCFRQESALNCKLVGWAAYLEKWTLNSASPFIMTSVFDESLTDPKIYIDTPLYLSQVCAHAGVEKNNDGFSSFVGNRREFKADDLMISYLILRRLVRELASKHPEFSEAGFNAQFPEKINKDKTRIASNIFDLYLITVENYNALEVLPFYPKPSDSKVVAECHKMFFSERLTLIEKQLQKVTDTCATLQKQLTKSISEATKETQENFLKIQTEQAKLTKSHSEQSLALKSLDNKVVGGVKTTYLASHKEARSKHTYAETLVVPSLNSNPRTRYNSKSRRQGRSPSPAVRQIHGVPAASTAPRRANVGTGQSNLQSEQWEYAGRKTKRAVKLYLDREFLIEKLTSFIAGVDYLKDFLPKMEFLVISKPDSSTTAIRAYCKEWPVHSPVDFANPSFWPDGCIIEKWKGDITEGKKESVMVKKFFANVDKNTKVESLENFVTNLYSHDPNHDQIQVKCWQVKTLTNKDTCSNFCVVVSRKDGIKPQDLLTREWARQENVFVKDWQGPLPAQPKTRPGPRLFN